jgi:CRP-like cAMP-binding protein
VLDLLEKALVLRSAPLFSALGGDAILPVASLCIEVELEPGERLFEAGQLGDSLYVVVRGAVRVERDGAVLADLGPGECVGELAVLDWEPRSATVVATRPSLLVRLERNDLMDVLVDHPDLTVRLAEVLVARLRKMQP